MQGYIETGYQEMESDNFSKAILIFLQKHHISEDSKFLLACSGGKDSMVMVDLFVKSKLNIGLAHINHGTRDGESDRDEEFVRRMAMDLDVPLFVKKINLYRLAEESSKSPQMVARDIRYGFFTEIVNSNQYDFIVTAHSDSDMVETFFINLNRSAGISGLSSIDEKKDKVIRPLLHFTSQQILSYADKNKIEFVQDSSNDENIYERNIWRNHLLPEVETEFPKFQESVSKSIHYLKESQNFISKEIDYWLTQNVQKTDVSQKLSLTILHAHHSATLLLRHWLQPYGYNATQIEDLWSSQNSGSKIEQEDTMVVRNRKSIELITDLSVLEYQELELQDDMSIPGLGRVSIQAYSDQETNEMDIVIPKSYLDNATIRKWKEGDKIITSGMTKSIKKYFIDEKYSMIDKKSQWLLTYQDDVIWIIGKRYADIPQSNECQLIRIR